VCLVISLQLWCFQHLDLNPPVVTDDTESVTLQISGNPGLHDGKKPLKPLRVLCESLESAGHGHLVSTSPSLRFLSSLWVRVMGKNHTICSMLISPLFEFIDVRAASLRISALELLQKDETRVSLCNVYLVISPKLACFQHLDLYSPSRDR
jgi:hypothetical protein